MGIALPTWIVESQNNWIVLAAYGLLIGVGIPMLVARWWYGSRSRTKDGVLNATALSFFIKLKDSTKADEIPLMLAQTQELASDYVSQLGPADEDAYKALEGKTLTAYKELYGADLALENISTNARRALVFLNAYLLRVEAGNARVERIKLQCGHYAEKLLNSLLAMSTAHSRLAQSNMIRDMIACFVQAVPLHKGAVAELLQLPHMTLPLARTLAETEQVAKYGLQGLWKVPDAERRKLLVGDGRLTAAQYDECLRALSEWPRIELVDVYFTVIGEEHVTAGSLMQLVVKLRMLSPKRDGSLLQSGRRLDAKERDSVSVRSGTGEEAAQAGTANHGKHPMGVVHAPYFAEERVPQWFIQMGDRKNDRLILVPIKFGELSPTEMRVLRLNVGAPSDAGLYTFWTEVFSDSYLGSSGAKMIKLEVHEPPEPNPDDEDVISDPEEDTIAGQMALMRGERVKPSGYVEDDDDDEVDDEDDDEEDDNEEDSDRDSDSDSD